MKLCSRRHAHRRILAKPTYPTPPNAAGRPQWSAEYPGGAMLAPVAFCLIAVAVLAATVALYTLLAVLQQRNLLGLAGFTLPPSEEEEEETAELRAGLDDCNSAAGKSHSYHRCYDQHQHQLQQQQQAHPSQQHDDSANHSDDNDSQLLLLEEACSAGGSSGVAPFQIAQAHHTAARAHAHARTSSAAKDSAA